jgi:pimeloyl-ACP methyl ester carboxylesterase
VSATERAVTLADGRELAVWEGGDPGGRAVMVHHGTPMAGLLYEPHTRDAREQGIRLVSYSRPGYGSSTASPGRTVGDAAADVAELADALGIDRFGTWGISGGGPHALACAALLPDRVVAAASLAGVTPYGLEDFNYLAGMGEDNVVEFTTALEGSKPLRALLEPQREALLAGGEAAFTELFASLLSPVDRAAYSGELAAYMFRVDEVGLEHGVEGWLDDDLAFVAPWGFDVADIRVPTLVWQGLEDRFVPSAHGEWLAAHVPGAEARIRSDDGHLTIIERRVPEVHAWLLERF